MRSGDTGRTRERVAVQTSTATTDLNRHCRLLRRWSLARTDDGHAHVMARSVRRQRGAR
jgi:hypothetical protein